LSSDLATRAFEAWQSRDAAEEFQLEQTFPAACPTTQSNRHLAGGCGRLQLQPLLVYSIRTHLRIHIRESTLHTRQRSFPQSGTEPATPVRPRRLVELAMCVRVCARICLAMHDLCQCQYYTPTLISVALFPYSRGINYSLLLSTLSILLGVFVLCLLLPSSLRLSTLNNYLKYL
jgi:hypothetical protein